MLRKRSRAVQDQGKGQQDLRPTSCFSSESAMETKTRSSSFFSIPGLLVSFTGKGLSESDSMRSPTSPLDYRIFSNLVSSLVRSPRSPARRWDCSGVGLGLVNSFGDDKVPGRSDSKSILLGSQMRLTNITSSKKLFSVVGDEDVLPKDSTISQNCFSKLEFEEYGKSDSCTFDLMPRTKNHNFDVCSSAELFYGSMGYLSSSEDYTCITSHGPNPKTTHMFGDRILQSSMIETKDCGNKEGGEGGGSHWIIKSSVNSPPCPSSDFLTYCDFCSKKLEEGRDIYMYRGEEAFCSWNCREQVILIEEKSNKENYAHGSCHFPSSLSFHEEMIFLDGMAATS